VIGFLRRFQPANPLVAVAYWLALVIVGVGVLFGLFFLLDAVFGLTPFDSPGL
jgi:hypothetical protein